MLPYLLMFAAPGSAAIMAIRRTGYLLAAVAILYWVMVGWRFQIGVDWNNYHYIYSVAKDQSLGELLADNEPGFRALLWFASASGGGLILVNVMSALVFCWGFFALAKRCLEPFLAIVVATPLVVVAVAMSGTRQAMAMGIIYYAIATWDKRGTLGRTVLVVIAGLFHFSAMFNVVFVVLGAKLTPPGRLAATTFVILTMLLVLWLFPDRFEFYSEAYVGEGSVTSPGALAHVILLAIPATVYFAVRGRWNQVLGDSPLLKYLAIASLMLIPAAYVSSVGASRFSFYLWPVAMYVWSGMPALLRSNASRYIYRMAVVGGSLAVLILWLQLANSSWAYVPYRNWWFEREDASLYRRGF